MRWGRLRSEDGQLFCAAGELVVRDLTEINLWRGKDVLSVELFLQDLVILVIKFTVNWL